ncbi:MAG TPA: glycosyltransferase family 39 protein [Candidatus Nanoarchaeia archaeon]|nr:glycosyltransferase family 39 protein [Candidatus Nanoarchaeia archaeon]
MKLKKYRFLALIIVLFLLTRMILIYTSPDTYDPEACVIGNTASELLEGLKQPYNQYEHQNNYGNTLMTPFLLAPLFIVLGKTSLSILLAGILVSLSMLIALYIFLKKFFDGYTAEYASILFILSPASYTISELFIGHGHVHITLFILIALFFFFKFYFEEKNTLNLILFGFFSGLGLFFSNIFLFILPPCILFWFFKDKTFFLKIKFFIFLFSVLLGLIPWIYVNARTNFKGLSLFTSGFGSPHLLEKVYGIFLKFTHLILYDLPNSFNFRDILLPRSIINYSYYCIFLILFFYIAYKSLPRITSLFKCRIAGIPSASLKQLFIIITIVSFFFIFIISNFVIDEAVYPRQYRYLMPIFPFIIITLAMGISEISINLKKLSKILFFFLVVLGVIVNFGLISTSSEWGFEKNSNPEPVCYSLLGFNFGSRDKLNPETAFYKCSLLEKEEDRESCYKGVGLGVADAIGGNNFNLTINTCTQINEAYRNTCYLGAGWVVGQKDFFDKKGLTSDEDCNLFEEKYKPECYRGVGWFFGWYYGYYPDQAGLECGKLNATYNQHCYEWLGYVIGEVRGDITLGIKDCERFKDSSTCCKGLLEFANFSRISLESKEDYCTLAAKKSR